MSRKQLNVAINNRKKINAAINTLIVIESEIDPDQVGDETVEDYKKLNDKCDIIISKIKKRKDNKKK